MSRNERLDWARAEWLCILLPRLISGVECDQTKENGLERRAQRQSHLYMDMGMHMHMRMDVHMRMDMNMPVRLPYVHNIHMNIFMNTWKRTVIV